MQRDTWLWVLGAGALGWLLYSRREQVTGAVTTAVESGEDFVSAAIAGWKQVQLGPSWVPYINSIETAYGIPPDLLARIAYQESHFRPDIISGATASGPGALGMMQLMPQYFTSVRVQRPYSTADTEAQIREAAGELVRLADHYAGDWTLAVAGYNDGQGNVDKYVQGARLLPDETNNYVADVIADVPVMGALPA